MTINDEVRQLNGDAQASILGGPITNGIGFDAPVRQFVGVGVNYGGGYRGVGVGVVPRGCEDVLEGVEDDDDDDFPDVVGVGVGGRGGFTGVGPDPGMLKESLARVAGGGGLGIQAEPAKPKEDKTIADDGGGYFGFVGASKPRDKASVTAGIGRGGDSGAGYFGVVGADANKPRAKPKVGNGAVGKPPFGFVGVGAGAQLGTASGAARFRESGYGGW